MANTTPIPTIEAQLPAYKRIATVLRDDILSGKYAPGSLLPSTEDFAATLGSSYYTVHTALTTLVKEGWVERLHGHGTYVAKQEQRFLNVGIYHSLDIFSNEEMTFQRRLNDFIVGKFQALGKTTQLLIDSRPEQLQDVGLYPPLAHAIEQRQIHCLVAPDPNSKTLPQLHDLPIPTAFMTDTRHRGVSFDEEGFVRGGVRALAEQGCRTIGFITSIAVIDGDFSLFTRTVKEAGLTTRPEWMIQPPDFQPRLIDYGYHSFRRLWKSSARPDGLLVYPDTAARGAITAILQAGVRVPDELKVAFHRNAHARVLCPFPVTWGVTDESAAAEALVTSIQKQFAGEKPARVTVPCTFERDDAAQWLS